MVAEIIQAAKHANVEYIAQGKAHKKYEFGVKVSVATTNCDNTVVGIMAEPCNPYDGQSLAKAIDQVDRITGCAVGRNFVDRDSMSST